jgi:hypothetical protein
MHHARSVLIATVVSDQVVRLKLLLQRVVDSFTLTLTKADVHTLHQSVKMVWANVLVALIRTIVVSVLLVVFIALAERAAVVLVVAMGVVAVSAFSRHLTSLAT